LFEDFKDIIRNWWGNLNLWTHLNLWNWNLAPKLCRL